MSRILAARPKPAKFQKIITFFWADLALVDIKHHIQI